MMAGANVLRLFLELGKQVLFLFLWDSPFNIRAMGMILP
jgi:hypothetical protein